MKKELTKLIDANLDKKIVIVRANLNVQIKNGEIVDESKIRALIPTLTYLQKTNCKTIILSHMGEDCSEYNDDNSFLPVRFALGRLMNKPIKFVSINNCVNSIKFMEFGDILLLENLCFSSEEFTSNKKVKEDFIYSVAQFAEYYVDESFGVSQSLASTSFLPKLLKPLLGINHEDELIASTKIKKTPKVGFVSVIGGKYSEEKLISIEKLIKRSEKILLGGEVALEFSKENKETKQLLKLAKENSTEIILPEGFIKNSDIDKKSVKKFQAIIESAKTLVLNGTMGISEDEKFGNGTNEVFETAAFLSTKECYKVAGGDKTLETIFHLKIKNKKFNHLTTSFSDFVKNI